MLKTLRLEAQKKLLAKNIAPLLEKINALPHLEAKLELGDSVRLEFDSFTQEQRSQILECAIALKPWRKGPFELEELKIESEWNS